MYRKMLHQDTKIHNEELLHQPVMARATQEMEATADPKEVLQHTLTGTHFSLSSAEVPQGQGMIHVVVRPRVPKRNHRNLVALAI